MSDIEKMDVDVDVTGGIDRAVRDVGGGSRERVDDVVDDPGGEDVMVGRERAFCESDGVEFWRGKELCELTSGRESLFSRIREFMGAPALYDALSDLSLFVGDAQLLLWLCAHEYEELIPHLREPEKAVGVVLKWADEHVPREAAGEAVSVALRIYNGSRANVAENAPDDDADGLVMGN